MTKSVDVKSERENVLRRCLNIAGDVADVTCGERLLQKVAPETGKLVAHGGEVAKEPTH